MLSKISWSSFIWVLIPVIISYYLFVFIAYFRKEIFTASAGRKIMPNRNIPQKELFSESSIPENKSTLKPAGREESDDKSFTQIHELLEDLKTLFARSGKENMVKEELIQAIRSKLKEYPGIREEEIREDINEHINMEARVKCSIDLAPEDLKLIWAA